MIAKYSIDKEQDFLVKYNSLIDVEIILPIDKDDENQSENLTYYGLSDEELIYRFGGSIRRDTRHDTKVSLNTNEESIKSKLTSKVLLQR